MLLDSGPVEMNKKSHKLNLLMEGMPITHEGIHRFIIEFFNEERWILVKELNFNVKLIVNGGR